MSGKNQDALVAAHQAFLTQSIEILRTIRDILPAVMALPYDVRQIEFVLRANGTKSRLYDWHGMGLGSEAAMTLRRNTMMIAYTELSASLCCDLRQLEDDAIVLKKRAPGWENTSNRFLKKPGVPDDFSWAMHAEKAALFARIATDIKKRIADYRSISDTFDRCEVDDGLAESRAGSAPNTYSLGFSLFRNAATPFPFSLQAIPDWGWSRDFQRPEPVASRERIMTERLRVVFAKNVAMTFFRQIGQAILSYQKCGDERLVLEELHVWAAAQQARIYKKPYQAGCLKACLVACARADLRFDQLTVSLVPNG